ncbi:unnamed protein product [Phaedon cochleariae]|uniref:Cyclic nucleotide-binding domain-containing protein n=1 Tax=Phaedon cochleariae TaxID=80249 RepID=A0A9P0GPU6_PHACE|nr:unnamed protein product [Phaedon cochleariae]
MHVYGTIQILFGVGYGDVFPRSLPEVILFIGVFLVGQVLLVCLVASMTLLMINSKTNEVFLAQKQKDIARYVEDLDPLTKSKTNQYYKTFWTTNNPSFLDSLPSPLKTSLVYDMKCGLLHRSMLLKDLPELILTKLASAMKLVRHLPGDAIYHQYVVKTCMICVENGVLELLHNEDGESSVICFRKGTILGEVSLFFNVPSKGTVRATKFTELNILEKSDFIRIMRNFPEVLRGMRKTIESRLEDVSVKKNPIIKPFSVTCLRRLKRKLNKTVEDEDINESKDYSKLYKISRRRNIFNESIVCIKDSFPWILQDNSYPLKTWKFINNLIQISYCLVYPYYVIFQYVREPMVELGIIADVLCFLDVLLQCITAVSIEEQELLSSVPKIIDHRLDDFRFDLDVFSLFPIEVWGYLFSDPVDRIRYYDLFKFNRLLRLHKINEIIKLFNNNISSISYVGCVLRITLYTLLILYYFSCLLFLNAYFYGVCDSNSWYYLSVFEWDKKNHPMHPVVDSIFFTTTAFFFNGFVDYLPRTRSDVAIVLMVMLSGLIFNSYFTSRLISSGYFEIFHVGGARLRPLFRGFSSLCRISYSSRKRIERFLKIDPCLSSEGTKKYINDTASNHLTSLIECCKLNNTLADTPLFQMVDGYFLKLMEKEAKLLKLPYNEVLYTFGTSTREMFVLQEGFCDVYNSEDGFDRNVGPGYPFGMLEMLFCIPKKHTVVTTTDCVFVRIEYGSLYKIMGLFPREHDALEEVVHCEEMVRAVKRMQMEEDLETFFEARDHRDPNQPCFINLTKHWPNYCQVFRRKMGSLWPLGVLLLPVSIHPEGFFLTLWCSVRCFLIFLSSILDPLTILAPPFADELYWWLVICHASIYIDMYLSLHIAYYDGKGAFKIHPAYTSWYYLSHSFLLDFLCALPWEKLMFNSDHNGSETDLIAPHHHHNAWKLVKLLQLYKVIKFFGYLEMDLFKRFGTFRLVQIALAAVVVVNVFATLGIRQICRYLFDGVPGRVETIWEDGNGTVHKGYLSCDIGFWKENSLFDQLTDPLELLLIGVYGVVNIITSTSLGDLKPATSTILIGTTLATIIGFIIFSIFTSIVVGIMLERAEETFQYRESVGQLMKFFNSKKLSSELRKKAFRHFKLTWERTGAQGDRFHSIQKMQAEVPLLNDILLNYYQNILEEVPLFYDLDTNLLRLFVDKIQVKHFRKGQIIVRPKDLIHEIFIVASGQIEVISGHGQTEILDVSGIFGNIQKSVYSRSSMSAVARRNVELWVINTAELFDAVKYYPVVLDDMDNVWKKKLFYMSSSVRADDISSQSQEVDVVDQMESEVEEITRKSSILLRKYKPVQFCIPQRWFRFALEPNHDVFKVLDFITVFSSILNIFAIPYIFVTQENSMVDYIHLVFEPVYYVRIFFKLHQSHINFYGNLVKTNSKIYRRYLNSSRQVFWDVAPNLPVYLTCFVFPREEWFFSYSCLRLIHLLRFVYISEYFDTYCNTLGAKYWLPLAKSILYYTFFIHILACIWFMMSCPFDNCHPDSWIFKFGNDVSATNVCYRVVLSYYFVLSLLTTTGIGDVSPENVLELCFALITILIGKIMISNIIGSVLRYVYQSEKTHLEYERDSKQLVQYLRNRNVSEYLIQRTWTFLKNQWDYEKCLLASKIFEELPYTLRQEISVSLYGDYLRETFLFKDIDENLLSQICSKLTPRTFFKHDYIVKHGHMDSTMYFIVQGEVCVSTKHDDLTETRHVILHAKDLFGVSQGLDLEAHHNFCYRPQGSEVEVLTLRFDDWAYMLGFFPKDNVKIFSRVQNAYLQ